MKKYEFAIKKDTLKNGDIIYTPVVRKKGWSQPWNRITRVENSLMLQDIDWDAGLTFQECERRIEEYKEMLAERDGRYIQTTEFHKLEEKER